MNEEPTKITIMTALSFVLGCLSAMTPSPWNFLIVLPANLLIYKMPNMIPTFRVKQYYYPLTLTTYIFGFIDAICFRNPSLFSTYLIIVTMYHYGQFQLINCYHNHQLRWQSFLIYHSPQYTAANVTALLEHVLLKHVFHFGFKQWHILVVPAFLMMVAGLTIRLLSFYTAKSNFTHLVQYEKKSTHQLVTHGIYRYMRHPGYMGFFYYSVGSMIFIGNPVCCAAYVYTLQKFFKERIEVEEYYLEQFFDEYENYKKMTPTLIPFIK